MQSVHGKELRQIAEEAEEWLERLSTASLREREDFLAWLRRSPLHVREILAAVAFAEDLRHLDPQRHLDVDALIAKARSNVISVETRRPV